MATSSSQETQTAKRAPARPSSSTDYWGLLLGYLGAPDTPQNRVFLGRWQAAEGHPGDTPGYYNPLNIIGSSLGSTGSYGVRQFGTERGGAQATASFLFSHQDYTSPIIHALRTGNPYNGQDLSGVAHAFAEWSGHRGDTSLLSPSYLAILGKPSGSDLVRFGGGKASESGFLPSFLHPSVGLPPPFNLLPGSPSLPGSGAISGAIGGELRSALGLDWFSKNWDRILEVVGGSVLVLVGLWRLAASTGVAPGPTQVVGGPGKMIAAGAVGEAIGRREYARAGSPPPAKRDRSLSKRRSLALDVDRPRERRPSARPQGGTAEEEIPF